MDEDDIIETIQISVPGATSDAIRRALQQHNYKIKPTIEFLKSQNVVNNKFAVWTKGKQSMNIQEDEISIENIQKVFSSSSNVSFLRDENNNTYFPINGKFMLSNSERKYEVVFADPNKGEQPADIADLPREMLQKSLLLSDAAYAEDPRKYLQENFKHHEFTHCQVCEDGYRCVIAYSKNEVYIAFRGTSNWKDILTDASFLQIPGLGGSCHAGNHFKDKLFSVTFAAPMIADAATQNALNTMGLHKYLWNFVHENDPVPRLLNLSSSITEISKKAKGGLTAAGGLLTSLGAYFANPVIATAGVVATSINEWLNSAKNFVPEYYPVGGYCFMYCRTDVFDGNKWQFLVSKSFSETASKLMNVTISAESLQQHMLTRYSWAIEQCGFIKETYSITTDSDALREIRKGTLFRPSIDRVNVAQNEEKTIFTVTGKNLSFASYFFSDLNNREKLKINEVQSDYVSLSGSLQSSSPKLTFHVEMETKFNETVNIPVPKSSIKIMHQKSATEQQIDGLNIRAILRALLQQMIQQILRNTSLKKESEIVSDTLNSPAFKLAQDLEASCLETNKFRFKSIIKGLERYSLSGFQMLSKVSTPVEEQLLLIEQTTIEPVVVETSTKYVDYLKLAVRIGVPAIVFGGGILVLAFMYDLAKSYLSKKEQQTSQYKTVVSFLVSQIGTPPEELQFDLLEMEKCISTFVESHWDLSVQNADQIMPNLVPGLNHSSKVKVIRRLKAVHYYYTLKQLSTKSLFVGVVGIRGSGKSTLVNKLWGFPTAERTMEIAPFKISDSVVVLDFPGVDDNNAEAAQTFYEMGNAMSICVLVVPIGKPGKYETELIKQILQIVPSNEANPSDPKPALLVCLNQADRFEIKHEGLKNDAPASSKEEVNKTIDLYAKEYGISRNMIRMTTAIDDTACIEYGVLKPSALKKEIFSLCTELGLCSPETAKTALHYTFN